MGSERVAAALVGVEGAAAIATGVGIIVAALVGHPSDRGTAAFLGALLAVFGVAIVVVARGFVHERGWARTPAYLVQFFALVVAWYQRHTLPAVTAALAVVAVATVLSLSAAMRAER